MDSSEMLPEKLMRIPPAIMPDKLGSYGHPPRSLQSRHANFKLSSESLERSDRFTLLLLSSTLKRRSQCGIEWCFYRCVSTTICWIPVAGFKSIVYPPHRWYCFDCWRNTCRRYVEVCGVVEYHRHHSYLSRRLQVELIGPTASSMWSGAKQQNNPSRCSEKDVELPK